MTSNNITDAAGLVDELLSGSFETMEQVDAARAALLDYIAGLSAENERLTHERDAWAKSKRELQHQQYEQALRKLIAAAKDRLDQKAYASETLRVRVADAEAILKQAGDA